jgi:hypothetical protein
MQKSTRRTIGLTLEKSNAPDGKTLRASAVIRFDERAY